MKKIVLLLVATVFMSVSAQKKAKAGNYKWIFALGANAVDMRVLSDDFGDVAKDHIGFKDVNMGGIPVKATIERRFNNALGLQFGFSMNEINRFAKYDGTKDTEYKDSANSNAGAKFMAIDGKLNLHLASLFGKKGWFDPYLNIGAGWSKIGEETKKGETPTRPFPEKTGSDIKINAGYGANLWLTKTVALKLESGYNHAFAKTGTDYFQHMVGLAFRFGRPDRDKDGVVDDEDVCPDTPGLVEFKGCPDTDGDGIKDSDDACPKVAGLKEMNGCPDEDGDSVKDSEDDCPKVVGPKENKGCPWPDTDGDGITDNVDKCPKEAGVESEGGCPVAKPVVPIVDPAVAAACQAKIDEVNQIEIYFDTAKSILKKGEKAKLDKAAVLIKGINCPNVAKLLYLSGYADVRGSDEMNATLSEKRASTVKAYLESVGVADFTLEGRGLGETDTKSDYLFNRRVELKIEK